MKGSVLSGAVGLRGDVSGSSDTHALHHHQISLPGHTCSVSGSWHVTFSKLLDLMSSGFLICAVRTLNHALQGQGHWDEM